MLNFEKNNRQKYLEDIISNLEEYAYRSKRYHVNFAIALGFCNREVNLSDFIGIKRKTDKYISLEKNLCCVVFDCIDSQTSIRAAENLQSQLQSNCLERELFLGVVTSLEYESPAKMANFLFDMLEKSLPEQVA